MMHLSVTVSIGHLRTMRLEAVLVLYVFDLVWAASWSPFIPPIHMVETGYRGRVEYILALITREDLNTGTPSSDAARAYVRRMSNYAHDDAGHLIGSRLGGTGTETYNIVPQNRRQNRGVWRTRVEQPIYDEVWRGGEVHFQVLPHYDGPTDTRPSSLEYEAWTDYGYYSSRMIVSGNITNPPPDEDEELFELDSLGNRTRVADDDNFEIHANRTYEQQPKAQYNKQNNSVNNLSKYFEKLRHEQVGSPVH